MQNNKHIRFAHYRQLDSNDKPESRAGATVAYITNEDGTISFALAECHHRDNYNKHMGRVKAGGRLNSPHHRQDTNISDSKEFIAQMDDEMQQARGYTRQYRHSAAPVAK